MDPLYYGGVTDGIYLTPGDFKRQMPHRVNEQCSLGVIAMLRVVHKHTIFVRRRLLSDSAMTFNAPWKKSDKSMLLEGYWRRRPLAFWLPPLPRVVRIDGVNPLPSALSEDSVPVHLAALVAVHHFAHHRRFAVEDGAKLSTTILVAAASTAKPVVHSTRVSADERLPAPMIT